MSDSPEDLIEEAARAGISIVPVGERTLRLSAPNGTLTDELRARLSRHKESILEILSGPDFRPRGPMRNSPSLTFLQGLWDNLKADPGNSSFTNGTHWIADLEGPFDAQTFEKSAAAIVRKHPILGTKMRDARGALEYVYGQRVAVEVHERATGSLNDCLKLAAEIIWRPFEIDKEALFRPFAVRRGANRHIVGFVMNHLIGDAVSIELVLKDLKRLYEDAAKGAPLEAEPAPLQYSDYICAMNEWLNGPAFRYRLKYWNKQLDGVPSPRFPPDFELPPHHVSHITLHAFVIDAALTSRANLLARRCKVTPFHILLAAHVRNVQLLTGQAEVVVLTEYHGRDSAELASIVGAMHAQFLMRMPVRSNQSFESLVFACEQVSSAAIKNLIPYNYVFTSVPDVGSQTAFPEFNFVPSYSSFDTRGDQSMPQPDSDDPRWRWQPLRVANNRMPPSRVDQFPGYIFNVWPNGDQIEGAILYLEDEYRAETMEQFAAKFAEVLADACGDRGM